MIELHLIGYTADAERLVLDLDPDGEGRYVVPIDVDLLATIEQLRDVRVRDGLPVDARPEVAAPDRAGGPPAWPDTDGQAPRPPADARSSSEPRPVPRRSTSPALAGDRPAATRRPVARRSPDRPRPPRARPTAVRASDLDELHDTGELAPIVPDDADVPDTPDVSDVPDAPEVPDAPDVPGTAAGSTGGAAATVDAADEAASPDDAAAPDVHEHRPSSSAVPHAQLSPAEIQAQLRAGRSVRAVATAAGTDRAWIERWLPPIVAERERMLAEARRRRLDVPRARALGTTVDRALAERGVAPGQAAWSTARRADGRWRVSVRFDDRGRTRTATWVMDLTEERLQAASPLAEELAGPGRRAAPRRR